MLFRHDSRLDVHISLPGPRGTSRIPQGHLATIGSTLPTREKAARLRVKLARDRKQMERKQTQLVLDKITIPATPPRASRPRLIEVLRNNLGAFAATIINGRAGTGKTTLTADFARQAGCAVSWYKVDAADFDLGEFMGYLLKSLSLQRPSIHPDLLLQLTDGPLSDRAELLAESLVFRLSESNAEPLLVVIEDLHLVYDAHWVVPFFHRLLPLLPADVHVLITCRSMPPAPLWRLRSKQMLRVMDEAELAFTIEEAVRLFESYGLSEDHARIAMRQTNGRASVIDHFASTPGRAGRALADNFLAITPRRFESLTGQTPDFQT
jgi:ATP/maltotriose-dependent transcriptional regulator MalT